MRERSPRTIILLGGAVVLIAMGVRQSFGLFLSPITDDLEIGRETFSLAVALQNLIFGLPLVGILADRLGARAVLFASGLVYSLGLLLASSMESAAGIFGAWGVLPGLALSGASYVVVLGAVGRVVPPERRSTAFGLITAAGSFGMFAVVPLAQWLLSDLGWRDALQVLGIAVGLIAILGLAFPGRAAHAEVAHLDEPLPTVLRRAWTHRGYLLLTGGFFVCGFHVAFVATHLPAYLTDNGLPEFTGASALALIGVFNIVGSSTFGILGDRFRKRNLLSILYISRAIVFTLFLVIPLTSASALVFGATIGFLWLATVPLTSGVVAQIFGSRYLSTLYGFTFLSHQVGAFLGVWLGGRVFDSTGSYDAVWITAVALGLVAGLIHLPLSDKPLSAQPAEVPAS
jgi:predicted MFS family arabinose efflux permease